MPRRAIDLSCAVDELSILDADGNLDRELEPEIPEDVLRRIHRGMLLARRFDERMLDLQRQGRIGTFAPVRGQEACQVPAAVQLRESDWMLPSYRETPATIVRGQPLDDILVAGGGFLQGNEVPEGARTMPLAVPVGTQVPMAAGLGYAIKLRGGDEAVLVFFGDGATSQGDVHEGLNFAGVFALPVVFLCQNNQWAISVPRSKQTKARTLAQKGIAYGIPGIQVDGNDALAVYVAVKEALDRARSGGGPTLIECVTYRLSLHTTADDPTRYRKQAEVAEWEKKDPLLRFEKYLKDNGLLDDDAVQGLEKEIKAEIQAAVDKAEARMKTLAGEALVMFDHVYAERPPDLEAQRADAAEALGRVRETGAEESLKGEEKDSEAMARSVGRGPEGNGSGDGEGER